MAMTTKKLTLGAMIVALYGCFALLNTYTGSFFDIYFCYFMVFPLVYYGSLYGWKNNLLVAFCSFIVISLFGVPFYTLFGLGCLIQGVILAEGIVRKEKSWNLSLLMMVLAMLKYVLITTVFGTLTGMDLYSELQLMLVEFPFLEELGMSYSLLESLVPSLLILLSAVDTYCILAICLLLSKRLKMEFKFHLSLIDLRLSKPFALIALGCILLGFYTTHVVILNLRVLMTLLLSLQGLSFIAYSLWLNHKSKFLILFMLFMFIPYCIYIYIFIGVIDIFSDLRRKLMYNKHRS